MVFYLINLKTFRSRHDHRVVIDHPRILKLTPAIKEVQLQGPPIAAPAYIGLSDDLWRETRALQWFLLC
jgi:hypothetical protein